jgi:phosphate transport system ATP-binding protein
VLAGSGKKKWSSMNHKIVVDHLFLNYSDGTESLKDINLVIPENSITVLFGPAGGGKSSLLRVINRLNELADVVFLSGKVLLDGENVLDPKIDINQLRRKIGMVLPDQSFADEHPPNLTYGLEIAGVKKKSILSAAERSRNKPHYGRS